MIRKFSFAKSAKKQTSAQGAQDAYVIEFTAQTPKSVDEIWGALVKPDKVTAWLVPVSGKLAKGGSFVLGGFGQGEITVCEPKRRLGIDLALGAQRQSLDISFAEEGKGKSKQRIICVKITAKISDLPAGNWEKFGPAILGMGWEMVAHALLDHLTYGPNAAANRDTMRFAASAEGRAFCAQAFDSWHAAALAGGLDAGAMSGPAPSVLAVYTGLHR